MGNAMELGTLEKCLWLAILACAVHAITLVVDLQLIVFENPFPVSMTVALCIVKIINIFLNLSTIFLIMIGGNAASNAATKHIKNKIRSDLVRRKTRVTWLARRTMYWLAWFTIVFGTMFTTILLLLSDHISAGKVHKGVVVPLAGDIITMFIAVIAVGCYTFDIEEITNPIRMRKEIKELWKAEWKAKAKARRNRNQPKRHLE